MLLTSVITGGLIYTSVKAYQKRTARRTISKWITKNPRQEKMSVLFTSGAGKEVVQRLKGQPNRLRASDARKQQLQEFSTCAGDLKSYEVIDTLAHTQRFREHPCRFSHGGLHAQL